LHSARCGAGGTNIAERGSGVMFASGNFYSPAHDRPKSSPSSPSRPLASTSCVAEQARSRTALASGIQICGGCWGTGQLGRLSGVGKVNQFIFPSYICQLCSVLRWQSFCLVTHRPPESAHTGRFPSGHCSVLRYIQLSTRVTAISMNMLASCIRRNATTASSQFIRPAPTLTSASVRPWGDGMSSF
jgi:hypothetical protein